MDNTLIDSDKANFIAYNNALKQLGFKIKPYSFFKKQFSKPKFEVAKAASGVNNKKILEKIIKAHKDYLHKHSIKYNELYYGVKEILRKLKKYYKIAIVSNCDHRTIVYSLKEVNLDKKYYDVLVGADDVKNSKPSPDMIIKAGRLLKIKPSYMIGDSIYDIIAGKRAGVKTIAVTSGNYNAKALLKYKPDYLVDDLKDVEKVL